MIRGATVLGLVVGTLLAVFVFAIKYDVQDLEAEYQTLNRDIEREQKAIHVLKAEWSYLNEPNRLRGLAKQYLGSSDLEYSQIGQLQLIPMRESTGIKTAKDSSVDINLNSNLETRGDPPGGMTAIEAALHELRQQENVQ
ncbi:MAG: hypothetical protein HON65_04820 [Rhodospirillales bacterium]|jgi:cell division protein FtsL|nr:hypothetical protein [Rhodospirillales bacterium]